MELVIGTKRWSTWSLRPWLALKHTGKPFTETVIALRWAETTDAQIRAHSPTGLVPVLKAGGVTIWDSLAICEYLAETFPDSRLWPEDRALRAVGRSATAEMHSGFGALRRECPMALGETLKVELSKEARADVARIVQLWKDLLGASRGPFLLRDWSIADAFYTPVATRFATYGIDLAEFGDDGEAAAYAARLLQFGPYMEWHAAAVIAD